MNDTDLRAEFQTVRHALNALSQGLTLLAEGQAAHSEMLLKILEAATAEAPPSDLTVAMERIFQALEQQTDTLVQVGERMGHIGRDIEDAVERGLRHGGV